MTPIFTVPQLVEALASIKHERWSDWQKYMHSNGEEGCDGDDMRCLSFCDPLLAGWERQIATPYEALSEREKVSAREQVARYWSTIVRFMANWIALNADEGDDFAERISAEKIARNFTEAMAWPTDFAGCEIPLTKDPSARVLPDGTAIIEIPTHNAPVARFAMDRATAMKLAVDITRSME